MKTVNIREFLDIFAAIDEILKLSTNPVRCAVCLGGYQPVPIRCALEIHTGQHAGIGDGGATVIWPEAGEKL